MADLKQAVDPSHTALIVIDMQNDFCHEDGSLNKAKDSLPLHTHTLIQEMTPNLVRAIDVARQVGCKVIFIRSEYTEWSNSRNWINRGNGRALRICAPGTWGVDWYEVSPAEGDLVMTKHRYSAFVGTPMELVLRAQGIQTVLVTGVTTNVCVESTARDAFMRDFHTVVIGDCAATYSHEVQQASLHNVRTHFGYVLQSRELFELWGVA